MFFSSTQASCQKLTTAPKSEKGKESQHLALGLADLFQVIKNTLDEIIDLTYNTNKSFC